MDVAIVSCFECFFSQRAESQLKGFFHKIVGSNGQKLDVRLQSYDQKEIDQQKVATEIHRSKLQILIISKHFLERLKEETTVRKKISPLNRILRPNRVVVVLLSLSLEEVTEGYQNVLVRFREWPTVELRATSKLDVEFCKAFTNQVVRIYSLEINNISQFSVFPKKVTKEQPKVIIMLKKPLDLGDSLRIELSRGRNTERIDGIITTNPYTAIVKVSDSLFAERTALIEISVFVNNNRLGAKLIKCEYQARQTEDDIIDRMVHALPGFRKTLDEHIFENLSKNIRANEDFSLDPALELMNDVLICRGEEFPTMMHFAAYYGLEQTVWILLEHGDGLEQCSISNDAGDTPLSIAHSRGFEISIGQTIKDFEEITTSCKAFDYVKVLYDQQTEKTYKSDDSVNDDNSRYVDTEEKVTYSNVEFAELVVQNLPLNDIIVEGKQGLSTEITQEEFVFPGFVENAVEEESQDLVSSVLIEETTPTAKHFDEGKLFAANLDSQSYDVPPPPVLLFETKIATGNKLIYYDTPRPSQEDYCIPPTNPKPVLPEKRPNQFPVLTKKTNTISSDPDGYIFVDPPHSSSDPGISAKGQDFETLNKVEEISKYPDTKANQSNFQINAPSHSSPQLNSPKQVVLDPTEEELVELMNGFKNNVYSMRELELLFENWKTRSDVQRDFKDKQKQLKTTRDHYKKIQESIRRNNRNGSPLDRILKFIPGSKKKHSTSDITIAAVAASIQRDEPTRKISSDRTSVQSMGQISDSDSEKNKGQQIGNVFWGNPLDGRFVTSYVSPTQGLNQVLPIPTFPSLSQPEDIPSLPDITTPPPRPFKKPSLECPTVGLSPPLSPFLNKRPPPLPPSPQVSTSPNPLNKVPVSKQRGISKKSSQSSAPPPPPPPRSTKNQPQFSYVSYKSEVNGLKAVGVAGMVK